MIPEEVAKGKRYKQFSGYSIQEVVDQIQADFGTIDYMVHSLANGPEVTKPLLETSRAGQYLCQLDLHSAVYKKSVLDILEASGVGYPKYYEWRSRSGCTFCFYQQKIEWVRLKERHPEAYEEAKQYEKIALENNSPFTWIQGESLTELEQPNRVSQIKKDFETRKQKEIDRRPVNPLRPINFNIELDELYLEDEGGGACLVCHK